MYRMGEIQTLKVYYVLKFIYIYIYIYICVCVCVPFEHRAQFPLRTMLLVFILLLLFSG